MLRQSPRRRPRTVEHCKCTTPLQIPSGVTEQSGNPSAPLFRLPLEILVHIFNQAELVDAVMLALSCKHLLRTSVLCDLDVPYTWAHQAVWSRAAASPITGPSCDCRRAVELLKRWPPTNRRGWNLCVDCLAYLPTKKSIWSAKRLEREWPNLVSHQIQYLKAVPLFTKKLKVQCPLCHVKELEFEPNE